MPRLLKLFAEARAALLVARDKKAAAALREQQLLPETLSPRAQAQAALDSASAARSTAAERLGETEGLAERRGAEARRRVEVAQQAQQDAAASLASTATGANLDEALDKVSASHAALRIAMAEEKRVSDAESLRVAEARAALAACTAEREAAATALGAAASDV